MKNIMFGTLKRSLISCIFIVTISFFMTKNPTVRMFASRCESLVYYQIYEMKNFVNKIKNECRKNKNNPYLEMRWGLFIVSAN